MDHPLKTVVVKSRMDNVNYYIKDAGVKFEKEQGVTEWSQDRKEPCGLGR